MYVTSKFKVIYYMPWTSEVGLKQWRRQMLNDQCLSYTGVSLTILSILPEECGLIVAPLTMGDENQVPITRVVRGLSFVCSFLLCVVNCKEEYV